MKNKLLKKIFAILASATVLSALMMGCSSPAEANGTLNLYVWTEYIPESVIQDFEKETGITVNVSYFSSNEELYAKLSSESEGAYDVIQPSDYMVEKMAEQDMLMELDKSKFTNLSNIYDAYLNPSYDPDNTYSVPYMGGVAAIAVNTAEVSTDISSYGDLFDPSLASSMVVLDDSRAIIGLTAASLGYSMSTTDSAELEEIKTKLLTLKDNIKLYDSDSPKSALISGDSSVMMAWNAEIALAMEENENVEIIFPEEGAYLFLDNWCIPNGAKNVEQAELFIDYILSAEASANCSAELPYLNPNEAACEILGEEFMNNPAKNIPQDVIANGEYIQNLDTETQAIYEEMWTELKK